MPAPSLQSWIDRGKDRALLTFALGHFFFVFLGAIDCRPFIFSKTLSHLSDVYQSYTGADSGYDFYAPEVGEQWRAVFEITEPDQSKKIATLPQGYSAEGDLRTGNLVDILFDEEWPAPLRRSIASSWAAKILQRYPDALDLTLRVQREELPPLLDYKLGRKAIWQDHYIASFAR